MTSGPNHTSTRGLSLPQWVKSKISGRLVGIEENVKLVNSIFLSLCRTFDFEENSFSPPTGDDGFFLVKYHNSNQDKLDDGASVHNNNITNVDISRHTTPCQDFIPNAKKTPREIGLKYGARDDILKSTGIDDGFKGEGAACGQSIVAVAQQMISERIGFKDTFVPPANQRVRRNSKSLPASPISSPKLLKRNPYFTKSVFGSSKVLYRVRSVDNSSDDLSQTDEKNENNDYSLPYKSIPPEYREMNCWTPVSM